MPAPKLVIPKFISIKEHPELSEKWVEDQIAENPSILGLDKVEIRRRQRAQPKAGRLDLLLEHTESKKRYEVELQLGRSDESHIIRAVEYWDFERKRYPQYEHCAVIVAEDITSRFLNVIGLFNGIIPLIAMKMQAYEVGGGVGLLFTKVIDELELGEEEPIVIVKGATTRADYERDVPKQVLDMVDGLYEMLKGHDAEYELNYTKYYIGLARSGAPNNFLQFRPKQSFLKLTFKMPQSAELEKSMEDSGLDVIGYEQKWRQYTIRITPREYHDHKELLANIVRMAYQHASEE